MIYDASFAAGSGWVYCLTASQCEVNRPIEAGLCMNISQGHEYWG